MAETQPSDLSDDSGAEIADFYERYIAAFNAGDHAGFASFFHLPLTVLHAARYDERRTGRPLAVVTDPNQLWAPLPDYWASTTVDAVLTLDEAAPFAARAGLTPSSERRPGLLATVTRWHKDGEPYEHLHVLYLLGREGGRLGIKVLVELAAARRTRPSVQLNP